MPDVQGERASLGICRRPCENFRYVGVPDFELLSGDRVAEARPEVHAERRGIVLPLLVARIDLGHLHGHTLAHRQHARSARSGCRYFMLYEDRREWGAAR